MKKAPNRATDSGARGEQLLLLPVPQIVATRPKPGTLPDELLRRLAGGAELTHPEWEASSRSWRLADSVYRLRLLGWPVRTHEIAAPTPEHPGRTIARYTLDRETLAGECVR